MAGKIELRPYQQKLIADIEASIRSGSRAVCAVSGCGSGKSIMQGTIAKRAGEAGLRTLFLVHRKELCEQIRETFNQLGVTGCFISMVQTVSRRIGHYDGDEYELIITDECHHSTASTYKKIYDHFPLAIRIGFTATPIRLNRGGLGEVYQDLVQGPTTQWLIQNHYLAPYHYYSVKLADTSGLHTRAGEFNQEEVSALMENSAVYGDTVKQWERLAKGKKTIIYCASVEAAEKTAEEFRKAGYNAHALSGKTSTAHRETAMQWFRNGEIQILCNCELFGEGLDVPDCECVVLLRPTQSLSLFIQQSMRSMRYKPGKTAIIIDHVGNCYRHGLPDDDRVWTLESKKKQEDTVKIRECPNCFGVYPPSMKRCPYCGAEAVHEVRTVNRKTVDVDLVEVRRQETIKNTRLSEANLKTWAEVVEFQKLHSYKFGWCIRYARAHEIPVPKKYAYMAHKFCRD